MRILIVNTLYEPHILGGAERSVRILVNYLKNRGLVPIVATTYEKDYTDIIDGTKIYYIKTPNIYWPYYSKQKSPLLKPIWHTIDSFNPIAPRRIEEIIKTARIDILHTNNISGFSSAIWTLDIPKIHTIRDLYLMCIRSTMFKGNRECKKQCPECKLLSIPKKFMSQRVNAVTGISKYILDKHLSNGYFRGAKIKETIYNPIEKISGATRPDAPPIRFGYVGSLMPHKGIELLLQTFINLKHRDAILLIFGKSPNTDYEQTLRKKYEGERIRFMGFRKPEEIYPQIHVLVVPSLWNEPFGRVIPEAYSFGVPVIGSRRGGIPEIIIHGETGFIFDTPSELQERLEFFIENPHEMIRMGDNALEFAKRFLPENTIEKFIAIYEEIRR